MEKKRFLSGVPVRELAYAMAFALFLASCSRQPVYPEPERTATEVTIGMGTLKTDIPQFFTYHSGNRSISFFVLKTGDKVMSFYDACAKCYPQKLGYRFDGGALVCKACNVRYSLSEIEKGLGSCFPVRVPGSGSGQAQDSRYVIAIEDLEKGSHLF